MDGVGNAPSPVAGTLLNHGSENTGSDELADDPAEVDVCGEVSAESDRHDFGSVGGGNGLEDTPWQTAENLTGEEHGKVDSEEEDEEETNDGNHGTSDGLLVTETVLEDTGGHETENLANTGGVAETRTPCGANDRLSTGVDLVVEALNEGGEGVKVS